MHDHEQVCNFMYSCVHVCPTLSKTGMHMDTHTLMWACMHIMHTEVAKHVHRSGARAHAHTSILHMHTRGFTNDTTCVPLEHTCEIRACVHVCGARSHMRVKCVNSRVSLFYSTWNTRGHTCEIRACVPVCGARLYMRVKCVNSRASLHEDPFWI